MSNGGLVGGGTLRIRLMIFKGNQKAALWSNGSKYSKLKKH